MSTEQHVESRVIVQEKMPSSDGSSSCDINQRQPLLGVSTSDDDEELLCKSLLFFTPRWLYRMSSLYFTSGSIIWLLAKCGEEKGGR